MQQLQRIPLPARIMAIAFVIAMAVYFGFAKGYQSEHAVAIKKTGDINQAEAWVWELRTAEVAGVTKKMKDGEWEISVPAAARAKAEEVVGDNLFDKINVNTVKELDATKPSQFAGVSEKQGYADDKTEAEIHDQLYAIDGILAARVTLRRSKGGGMFADGDKVDVTAKIFKDPAKDLAMSGEELASMIQHASGTSSLDNINIHTQTGEILFDTRTTGSGGTNCSLENNDRLTITDKERCVKNDFEADLRRQIAPLVGGESNVIVIANVQLRDSAQEETFRQVNKGAVTDRNVTESKFDGDSSKTVDETGVPSERVRRTQTQMGSIERLSFAVTLNGADTRTQNVVRSMLKSMIDPRQGDKMVVRSTKFATTATKAADTTSSESTPESSAQQAVDNGAGVSGPLVVVAFVVFVVGATVLAMLYTRNKRLASEREVFENEFRNDMTRFQTVATRNPDDLAREIEQWLGDQSPQGPTRV